jgi:DNA polymerase-3 subunit gamma/tau
MARRSPGPPSAAAPSVGSEPGGDYLSLYRRYRPARFGEVLGQDHVTMALRNAVATGRVGHAYLFSGPRGTGKTSTARILAKALNCADPKEGEPCSSCDSCLAVARGSSLDVHELDAASNNGVEAMRELVARAALATPGKWKVYIVDEVHMLSTAASNALLKTLEEPPPRVVFVLATTDQQKVLSTIRSRTQHFEFHLLPPELLGELVEQVAADAGLDLSADLLPSVVRKARGSARDALSALDQAAASGVLDDSGPLVAGLADALDRRDAAAALSALDRALAAGRDPQVLAAELIEGMRQRFLAAFAPDLVEEGFRGEVGEKEQPNLASLVRAMEVIGRAQVDMRNAVDPRVSLEVALVRVAHPEVDVSAEALMERVERLERALEAATRTGALSATPPPAPSVTSASAHSPSAPSASAHSPSAPSASAHSPSAPQGAPPSVASDTPRRAAQAASPSLPRAAQGSGKGSARQALHQRFGSAPGAFSKAPLGVPPQEVSASAGGSERPFPSRAEVTKAWGDGLLASLSTRARARYKVGRFVEGEEGTATFALPNEVHRAYCEEMKAEVQSVLSSHFGVPIELVLVVDPEAPVKEVRGGGVKDASSASRAGVAGKGEVVRKVGIGKMEDEVYVGDEGDLLDDAQVVERAAKLMEEHFPGATELGVDSSGKQAGEVGAATTPRAAR